MYVLDTNVISELRKANSANVDNQVIQWAKQTPKSLMFISVVSILEIETGILLLQRKDPTQARLLRTWLENYLLLAFDQRVLDINMEIAQCCAHLHVPNPKPEKDALIGATALAYGMTIVTRNTKDYQNMGVKLINPWL